MISHLLLCSLRQKQPLLYEESVLMETQFESLKSVLAPSMSFGVLASILDDGETHNTEILQTFIFFISLHNNMRADNQSHDSVSQKSNI